MIPQVEQNYYKDIHCIAKTLEKIEQHLNTIAKSYEPITFDMGDIGMKCCPDFNHEDDGK